jgi:hypothetical protein
MDTSKIDNIEIEDIDTKDYPDFCDAHIIYAERDGIPLTDEEIEELNEDGEFVYEQVIKKIF